MNSICRIVLAILLLLVVSMSLVGESQASPGVWAGVWVSLNVEEVQSYPYTPISFAIEDSGVAHVAYNYWNQSGDSVDLKLAEVRGSDIETTALDHYAGLDSVFSDTRTDPLGRVHTLWALGEYLGSQVWNTSVVYYVFSNSSVIVADLTETLSLNLQYTSFALSVDAQGYAHIALTDFKHNLYYVTNSGGSWTKELLGCVGNAGGGQSIALDASGAVHISYVNRTDYLEYYYTLRYVTNAGGVWGTVDVFQGGVFPSTSLALDANRRVFIGCRPDYLDNDLHAETIGYATNINGPFEMVRTPFQGWVMGPRWLTVLHDGSLCMVYSISGDPMMHIARVSTSGQYSTETFKGGRCVEQDGNGYLHSFYTSAIYTDQEGQSQGSAVFYATNKFDLSSKPDNIEAIPGPGGASVSWSAPEYDGGLLVLGYRVYHGTNQNQMTLWAQVGPFVNSYAFRNLSASTDHYFSVAPVTLAGVGANSDIVNAVPIEPDLGHQPERAEHTLSVVAATVCLASVAAVILFALLKRSGRARVSSVILMCCAIAFTSLLPAYLADVSLKAEPDKWRVTSLYEGFRSSATSLAIDAHGDCHIVASSWDGLLYATNTSGEWVTTIINQNVSVSDVSMVVDTYGWVHVAFVNGSHDYYQGSLWYATNSGGDWSMTMVDDSQVRRCSLALDGNGDVHMGYSTAYVGQISEAKHAVRSGSSWEVESIESGYGFDNQTWFGNIAFSQTGEVILTYQIGNEVRYALHSEGRWNLTTLGEGGTPVLFMDATGAPNVCYSIGVYPLVPKIMYGICTSGTWSLTELGLSGLDYSFVLDSPNLLSIVFCEGYGSDSRLLFAEGEVQNMSSTVYLGDPPSNAYYEPFHASVALDSSGSVVISAIMSKDQGGRGGDQLTLFEKDLSDFTPTERIDKGWMQTRADFLGVWVLCEVLVFLAVGIGWRAGWWKAKPAPEEEGVQSVNHGNK